MLEYKIGNILTEDVEAIVNTVNCVGVMGRGIALQFKKAFPDNFKAYSAACKREEVKIGNMFVFQMNRSRYPHYVINFPTKRDWRSKSRIEDIEVGMQALVEEIRFRGIRSIALPPLGSGLGGLEWDQVRPVMEDALIDLENVRVVIFEPNQDFDAKSVFRDRKRARMTPGRAALIGLVHRYLESLLDPFVTLLEVHKLMYFMQVAGEQLDLEYKKRHYGPYAIKLRHVLNFMEGRMISGYADGGDEPRKQIELLPRAIDEASAFLRNHEETHARFDRVVDLIKGFESPFGLELLSTVHWVVIHEKVNTVEDVIDRTYAWNPRKKRFSPRQIKIAIDVLSNKGWIDEFSGSYT